MGKCSFHHSLKKLTFASVEIHKWLEYREYGTVGCSVLVGTSTTQTLYLRLREHCRRGRETVRDKTRMPTVREHHLDTTELLHPWNLNSMVVWTRSAQWPHVTLCQHKSGKTLQSFTHSGCTKNKFCGKEFNLKWSTLNTGTQDNTKWTWYIVYAHACTHVCLCEHACACVCTHVCMCMCAHAYACVSACVSTCA